MLITYWFGVFCHGQPLCFEDQIEIAAIQYALLIWQVSSGNTFVGQEVLNRTLVSVSTPPMLMQTQSLCIRYNDFSLMFFFFFFQNSFRYGMKFSSLTFNIFELQFVLSNPNCQWPTYFVTVTFYILFLKTSFCTIKKCLGITCWFRCSDK